MKTSNALKISCFSLSIAVLTLSGCATRRPPRQVGPPPEPVMPPRSVSPRMDFPPLNDPVFTPPVVQMTLPAVAPVAPVAPRKGTSYTIRKGESLSAIAARNKMGWKTLADYNYLTNPNSVRAGQVILIPPAPGSLVVPSTATTTPVTPPPAPANSGNTYVVQSGDSLSVVSRRYGTSVSELKKLNGLRSDRLLVGQILKVPQGSRPGTASNTSAIEQTSPRSTPVPPRPIPTPVPSQDALDFMSGASSETAESFRIPEEEDPIVSKAFPIMVQDGDTLESIANNYIVSVEEIRNLNNLGPNDEVKVGQKLQIPPSIY